MLSVAVFDFSLFFALLLRRRSVVVPSSFHRRSVVVRSSFRRRLVVVPSSFRRRIDDKSTQIDDRSTMT